MRVGVPLIGAVVLAAAAVLPAISVDAGGGLPAGEHVRARLFLGGQWRKVRRCTDDALVVPRFAGCVIDDHADATWGRRLANVRCTGGLIVATRIEPGADSSRTTTPRRATRTR